MLRKLSTLVEFYYIFDITSKYYFGPITGGSKYKNLLLDRLIRGFLFKIFYQISILILNLRQKKFYLLQIYSKKIANYILKKNFLNIFLKF